VVKPPGKAEIEKQTGEDANIESKRGWGAFGEFQNPDDLVRREGLDVYDRMMTDATVRMAVNSKRFAVVRSDWDIQPATNDEFDKKVAGFCKWTLEDMRGSLIEVLFDTMSAVYRGYSIGEMNFKTIADGEYKGLWGLESIRPKNPRDYKYDLDSFSNITDLKLTLAAGGERKLPLWKFIIYVYQPEDGRPWGRSDLRAAYKHWWSKDFLMKWWNVYMERFGAPTRVAKYPRARQQDQDKLMDALKSIMNNTSITIPDDIDIQFLTTGGRGAFRESIEYHDEQMVKAILGQTLTSGTGDGVGSYALGNVHRETLEDYVNFLRRDIAESVMRERVLRTLVWLNFPGVFTLPRHVWRPMQGELQVKDAVELEKLANLGIMVESDINPVRRQLGMPPSSAFDDNSDKMFVPANPMAGIAGPVARQLGSGSSAAEGEDDIIDIEIEPEPKKLGPGEPELEDEGDGEHKFAVSHPDWKPRRALFAAEERIGGVKYFKEQIQRRDDLENDYMESVRPVFEAMRDSVKESARKLLRKSGDLNGLKLPGGQVSQLKGLSRDYFSGLTFESYLGAMKEVNRPRDVVPDVQGFTAAVADELANFAKLNISAEAVPPEEALKQVKKWKEDGNWAKVRAARTKALAKLGAGAKQSADFWITGVVNVELLEKSKKAIYAGLQTMQGEKEIIAEVGKAFEEFIARGEQLAPELTTANRLQNIVRTNTTRAVNDARLLAFQDPAVVEDFPGLQASGVADDRQSLFCTSVDGHIYPASEPPPFNFPAHYNCRSIWISVIYSDDRLKKGFSGPPDLRLMSKEFGGTK